MAPQSSMGSSGKSRSRSISSAAQQFNEPGQGGGTTVTSLRDSHSIRPPLCPSDPSQYTDVGQMRHVVWKKGGAEVTCAELAAALPSTGSSRVRWCFVDGSPKQMGYYYDQKVCRPLPWQRPLRDSSGRVIVEQVAAADRRWKEKLKFRGIDCNGTLEFDELRPGVAALKPHRVPDFSTATDFQWSVLKGLAKAELSEPAAVRVYRSNGTVKTVKPPGKNLITERVSNDWPLADCCLPDCPEFYDNVIDGRPGPVQLPGQRAIYCQTGTWAEELAERDAEMKEDMRYFTGFRTYRGEIVLAFASKRPSKGFFRPINLTKPVALPARTASVTAPSSAAF